jgi:hypothetical protein
VGENLPWLTIITNFTKIIVGCKTLLSRLGFRVLLSSARNIDLTNYGQKKSIINIQDLGLSAASQHSIGGQPILQVIFRKLSILESFF